MGLSLITTVNNYVMHACNGSHHSSHSCPIPVKMGCKNLLTQHWDETQ